ncbi:MAG: phosphoribosylanthranilate isomerase [Alphaproteobacteria bacterium]|nr:phosphoribosylanthranilate isomerase [Alphaproteobacteria bacterium]
MNSPKVKICGITDHMVWDHCLKLGVDYLGLMFYPKSPRHISLDAAQTLSACPRHTAKVVAVTVNADDTHLNEIANHTRPDYWQFHGSETPQRLCEVYRRFGIPIIKALTIAKQRDFNALQDYTDVAEMFLLDAKPRTSDPLPGGNAHAFNWSLLQSQSIDKPWFLAGGLTPVNIRKALQISGAKQIDLSSGVEETRGIKSFHKITALMQAL